MKNLGFLIAAIAGVLYVGCTSIAPNSHEGAEPLLPASETAEAAAVAEVFMSSLAEIDIALRSGNVELLLDQMAVVSPLCGITAGTPFPCDPSSNEAIDIRVLCTAPGKCEGVGEATMRERLTDLISPADGSAGRDAFGSPLWRVFAYLDDATNGKPGEGQLPGGIIATGIVSASGSENQPVRRVMFLAIVVEARSWVIPFVLIDEHPTGTDPRGLLPASYYLEWRWHQYTDD